MLVKTHFPSRLPYKINNGCLYYKPSIAPNPKLLNDFEPSKEPLKNFMGELWKKWMNCSCKLLVKTLSANDHQGKTINMNIAKVQAQNVVFWPLDDIELVYWTTTYFTCKIMVLWGYSPLICSQTSNWKSDSEIYKWKFIKQVISRWFKL